MEQFRQPKLPRQTRVTGPYGGGYDLDQPDRAGRSLKDGFVPEGPAPDYKVPVTDEIVSNPASPFHTQAFTAARDQRADQMASAVVADQTPWHHSFMAGMYTSLGGSLLERAMRPEFPDEEPVDKHAFLEHVPLRLSKEEAEFFDDVVGDSGGVRAASWAIERIRLGRGLADLQAAAPAAAVAGNFVDPLNFVAPFSSARASKLLGAGRPAATATGVVTGAAFGAASGTLGEGPKSTEQAIAETLIGAAFGAAFPWATSGLRKARGVTAGVGGEASEAGLPKAGAVAPPAPAVTPRGTPESFPVGHPVETAVAAPVRLPEVRQGDSPAQWEIVDPAPSQGLVGPSRRIEATPYTVDMPDLDPKALLLPEPKDVAADIVEQPQVMRLRHEARRALPAPVEKVDVPEPPAPQVEEIAPPRYVEEPETIRPPDPVPDPVPEQRPEPQPAGRDPLAFRHYPRRSRGNGLEAEDGIMSDAGWDDFRKLHDKFAPGVTVKVIRSRQGSTAKVIRNGKDSYTINIPTGLGALGMHRLVHEYGHIIFRRAVENGLTSVKTAKEFRDVLARLQKAHADNVTPENLEARFGMARASEIVRKAGPMQAVDTLMDYIRRAFKHIPASRLRNYMNSPDEIAADQFVKYFERALYEATGKRPGKMAFKPSKRFVNSVLSFFKGMWDTARDLLGVKGLDAPSLEDATRKFFDEVARNTAKIEKGKPNPVKIPKGAPKNIHEEIFKDLYEGAGERFGDEVRAAEALNTSPDASPETAPEPPPPPAETKYPPQGNGQKSHAKRAAEFIAWNVHKTFTNFGGKGGEIADLLVDDNLNAGKVSVDSIRHAILGDLQRTQVQYESHVLAVMKKRGAGLWTRIRDPQKALTVQRRFESEVYLEMAARQEAHATGTPHVPTTHDQDILKAADLLDATNSRALDEMQRSGVYGAEHIPKQSGWLTRKWDSAFMEETLQRLEQHGLSQQDAQKAVAKVIAKGMAARTPQLPPDVLEKVSEALVDRVVRKGLLGDTLSDSSSQRAMAALRDTLKSAGLPQQQIEDIMDDFESGQDLDKGKVSFLKSRINMDLRQVITLPDGTSLSVLDLVDKGITQQQDLYLQRVATESAFARKGITRMSDVVKLREEFIESLPIGKRQEAANLFDNVIASFRGLPSGTSMSKRMRLFSGYGRMIALSGSGFWQITELATAMTEYGVGATLKAVMRRVPGFRALVRPTPEDAQKLVDYLSGYSSQSLRLRPFLNRFTDGWEIGAMDDATMRMQQGENLVHYANGMKFIHSFQAGLVADVLVSRLTKAVAGDQEAFQDLAGFGLDTPTLQRVRADVLQHRMDVDAWDPQTWDALRPVLYRAMDHAVLRGRTGDLPAFVQFDSVGKTLMAYRGFTLAAHNKLLAGLLANGGYTAVGRMMMIQFPLAVLAVQAKNVLHGQSSEDPVRIAVSQMGSLGLASEVLKVLTGESNVFGAPILIPADRAIRLTDAIASGEVGNAAAGALGMVPIIAVTPPAKVLEAALKE